MIRTDHQHFVVNVNGMRATASTLKAAEAAKRTLIEDHHDGFKYKITASITGPLPGRASDN